MAVEEAATATDEAVVDEVPPPAREPPLPRRGWRSGGRLLLRQLRVQLRAGLTGWTVAAGVAIFLVVLPLLVVFGGILGEVSPTWHHLADTVLADYVINSALLIVGTGALTLLLGVSTAWLVSTCDFPGRRTFEWALILPLAIPTYIAAYVWAAIFDYFGPVQGAFAALWPGADAPLLRTWVMTLPGAVVILALVLYPYVYLITRASFLKQSDSVLETARLLGRGPWSTFFRVALPLARPAWVAGVTLVLMEVLNEYGAVKYYGIPTFTTGIFRAWFPLNDPDSAMRLSGLLLVFVFTFILLERAQRGRARFHDTRGAARPVTPFRLSGVRAWGAFAACLLPVLLGFLLPVAQLLGWGAKAVGAYVSRDFLSLTLHSFALAVVAALLAVGVAVLVAYAARLSPTPLLRFGARLAGLGYSIPGAVIAVGVFVAFVWVDRRMDAAAQGLVGTGTGLLLSGTVVALVFGYVVRFLAVALNPVESGFTRICGKLDETARSLGTPPLRALRTVDLPLLKGTLLSAGLLVFVDVLKELPLTLMLRPFNFDTLATRAYQLATDELLVQSSLPALLIIAVGLVPVIVLTRLTGRGREDVRP